MSDDKKSSGSFSKAKNAAVIATKVVGGVVAAHQGTAADVDHLQKAYRDKSAAEAYEQKAERESGK